MPDVTFDGDGAVDLAYPPGAAATERGVHVHFDGSGYVAAAGSDHGALVARVSTSGVPDPAIGGGTGVDTVGPVGFTLNGIEVDQQGRLVFVGGNGSKGQILRMTKGLSLDPTFSGDGILTYGPSNVSERVMGVDFLPDRSLVALAYAFPTAGGAPRIAHLAVSPSGRVRTRRPTMDYPVGQTPRVTPDGRFLTVSTHTTFYFEHVVRRLKGLPPFRPLGARRVSGTTFRARVNAQGLKRVRVAIQARRNGRWKVIGIRAVPAKVNYRWVVLPTARRASDSLFRAVVVNASGRSYGKPFRG